MSGSGIVLLIVYKRSLSYFENTEKSHNILIAHRSCQLCAVSAFCWNHHRESEDACAKYLSCPFLNFKTCNVCE